MVSARSLPRTIGGSSAFCGLVDEDCESAFGAHLCGDWQGDMGDDLRFERACTASGRGLGEEIAHGPLIVWQNAFNKRTSIACATSYEHLLK